MSCATVAVGVVAVGFLALAARAGEPVAVRVVSAPPTTGPAALHPCYRPPLLPAPLLRLPIGSIRPQGWLRRQLVLQADGMVGHLEEISKWCNYEGNAWVNPEKGHSGWEEMPYWLKGYGDMAYVLGDEGRIARARRWIDAILASQREDGWFGPRGLLTSLNGKADLWPNMIVLNILQSWYEFSGDKRVLPFMARYFRWQLDYPEKDFLAGYWPKMRAGDNLESIHWLYNRTGEKWLLDVAAKVHRCCADWSGGVINWHGVNIAQGFREPAIWYMQAGDEKFLRATDRNYDTVMGLYGQFPGGGFAADENCRKGYHDPRQGFETCAVVEFMHSFEMLTRLTGNPVWADRCEELAFNTLPAALTPDLKALHYLTCANQVQLDRHNKAPGIQNGGTMFSYSPGAVYRCCQHNVAHGWPYYAQELWLATADGGLCASLYAASEVSARVGAGQTVKITEETDYPFGERITFRVSAAGPVRFPLYLRVPRWCVAPAVAMNGQALAVEARGPAYVAIDRTWADGDTLTLTLPMNLGVRLWKQNNDAVSVDYGPLTFSLKIGERWERYGKNEKWPDWEVFPTTPWNYGLELDEANPVSSLTLRRREGPIAAQPFTPDAAPIEITATARRIPAWTLDPRGLLNPLQRSPARSAEPPEKVTLIPMGCARLRISAFPTVRTAPGAHEWTAPPAPPAASHCWSNDTTTALNDGLIPKSSADQSIPRFTWWDHKGTVEWVQYDFEKPRRVKGVEVYWFDDTGRGGCRVPESWRVLWRDGEQWKAVAGAGAYGVELNTFNKVSFDPVETRGLRLEVRLQKGFSGGILEWRVVE